IDSDHYGHGFYLNNSENSSHQRYFRDANAGYNGHFWYTITMDATEHIAWASWTPNLPEDGYYEVMAYIPSVHATATTATYEITHANGINSVTINQLNYSDEWVSLGQYRFDPAEESQVFLGDNTGIDDQDIAYDAVKWCKVPDPVYISYDNITCYGDSNGTASVIINDTGSPHDILWNTGDTSQTLSDLPPATYSVTVTNVFGTSFYDTETIIEPDSLQINAELYNPVTAGTSTGSIITNATGGTGPYDYLWSGGETDASLTGIPAGMYALTLSDDNGCSASETYELTDPACNGTTNLTAAATSWNSITVSWTDVAEVNAYHVQYTTTGSTEWLETTTGNSPVVLSGLQPETTYDIRVASICTDTVADWQYCNAITPAISNTVSEACYGIFTDTGGENINYDDDEDYVFTISPEGAEKIVVNFYDLQIEADYDTLYVYDGYDTNSPLLTYFSGMIIDESTDLQGLRVASTDSALTFRFVSDYLTTEAGWYATWTSYGGTCASGFSGTVTDNLDNEWATGDFDIYTGETDNNGDGISHAFSCIYNQNDNQTPSLMYQQDDGFLYDPATSLNDAWIPVTGTWSFSDNAIFQSDESESNTNLYIPVNHTHGDGMLFEADIKVAGSGSNRRSGFHFACDAPTETERGNSYLVYIRPDQDELHLNEYIDNTWHNRTNDAYDFELDVYYNLKVYYHPQDGKITAWIDDELISSWEDSSPITTGVAFSLRSGNAQSWYKNLRIYRETTDGFTITTGADTTDQYHYQNPDSITPAGKIVRCITNVKNHIYTYEHQYNVDYTPPSEPVFVECTSAINDTLYDTDIEVAWGLSEDQHSGIDHYLISVGSAPELQDIMACTPESVTVFSQAYYDLPFDETGTYYINLKSVNGAGLHSPVKTSIPYIYESLTNVNTKQTGNIHIYPNPAENHCTIGSQEGIQHISIYDMHGKPVKTFEFSGQNQCVLDLKNMNPGHYMLVVETEHHREMKKLIL
ncbi:MAG: T9SS type A sorting domain-containing protein, partial [Bacteroidota bacterium]|nr:T9SS type A sorting domain-containing protein [Bacteroidota bacterium]